MFSFKIKIVGDNMQINLKNGGLVLADNCCFCDVYLIDIDEDRIELNDYNHFVIGTIDHNNIYDMVEVLKYDDEGCISDDIITLCDEGNNSIIQEMLQEELL